MKIILVLVLIACLQTGTLSENDGFNGTTEKVIVEDPYQSVSSTGNDCFRADLVNVTFPKFAELNKSILLTCVYDTYGGDLYVIKWYRNSNEFYRYMPKIKERFQTFGINGARLNLNESDETHASLHVLNFDASGVYTCEVSCDYPIFATSFRSYPIIAAVFPEQDPLIEGIKSVEKVGEYLNVNCTCLKTHPVVELFWYINGNLAPKSALKNYTILTTEGPLYSRTVGLRLKLEEVHFAGKKVLQLKCIAVMESTLKWQRSVYVRNSGFIITSKEAFKMCSIAFFVMKAFWFA